MAHAGTSMNSYPTSRLVSQYGLNTRKGRDVHQSVFFAEYAQRRKSPSLLQLLDRDVFVPPRCRGDHLHSRQVDRLGYRFQVHGSEQIVDILEHPAVDLRFSVAAGKIEAASIDGVHSVTSTDEGCAPPGRPHRIFDVKVLLRIRHRSEQPVDQSIDEAGIGFDAKIVTTERKVAAQIVHQVGTENIAGRHHDDGTDLR